MTAQARIVAEMRAAADKPSIAGTWIRREVLRWADELEETAAARCACGHAATSHGTANGNLDCRFCACKGLTVAAPAGARA